MTSITVSGLIVLASLAAGPAENEISKKPVMEQYASATCSLRKEQRAGARKYCYYDCGGTVRTTVIAAGRVCPFTIRR